MQKFLLLAFLLVWPSIGYPIASSQYNGNVNNSVASIIETKRKAQPDAANDVSGATTFGVINNVLNSLIPCVPAGVTWISYLYCVGATVAVGTTIQMGINGLVNLTKGEGQTVQASGSGMPQGVASSFPVIPSSAATLATYPPGDYYFTNSNGVGARHIHVASIQCNSLNGVTQWCSGANTQSASYLSYDFQSVSAVNSVSSVWYKSYTATVTGSELIGYSETGTPIYQRTYSVVLEETPATGKTVTFPSYIPYYGSPQQIIADIPAAQATVPLSDAMLAHLSNAILDAVNAQLATTTGATPIPPITIPDVAAWRATHPALISTGQDLNTPVSIPGSDTIHIPNPNTETALPPVPGTTPTPVSVTGIEWGTFTAPSMDMTPPTVPAILDPIFNLWPQWANFAFPAHTAVCPQPTIPLSLVTPRWQDRPFTELCTWTEQIRPTLQVVFTFVWSIAIVLIVMGA